MKKFIPFALAAALFSFASTAQAYPISSEVGDLVIFDTSYTSNYAFAPAVEITPHPLWQQVPIAPGNPARWISYANTGVGSGAEFAPFQPGCSAATADNCQPLMIVIEPLIGGGTLNLTAWADDTFEIALIDLSDPNFDLIQLVAPNFTQNVCADGAPGCEPLESVTVNETLDGDYLLAIAVYQVGQDENPQNNPFGVLYDGSFEQVPEPATLTVMAAGLFGLGFMARRRRSKTA